MKQFSKDLGNVSLAPKGKWSREQEYERLALVYNACDNLSYVAKINVPSGVDIENREYWQPMNATGYADNNFINLTTENENGIITAYETLEEAVATILPINRRAGATLSFYNLNSDRLDRQAEFELWQFNSTDLANWENKDYWNNVYYNWNVFVGWYIGADALRNHVKIPNVGQYAYVGSNLNDAILYQCRTNGTWTNTGTKVRNYISVVVSGNITIGDNGNWFSDGKDTGIPATPAVDEQLDNIGLQLQQHNTEIDKLQKQDVILKSNIDSNFETINNNVNTATTKLQSQITSNDNDIAALNKKHGSLSKTVEGIAATGGASTATNVTYVNNNSGLNAENAQDAIDELQGSKIDKTSILQELGEAEDKVMSQKAQTYNFGKTTALINSILSLDNISLNKGYIGSNGWMFNDNAYHFVLPIKKGDKITISPNKSQRVSTIGIISDYIVPEKGINLVFASGETRRIINSESTIDVTAEDAKYIIVNATYETNNYIPIKLIINNYDYLSTIQKKITSLQDTIDPISHKVSQLEKETLQIETISNKVNSLTEMTLKVGFVYGSSWNTNEGSTHFVLPIKKGDVIDIVASSSNIAICCIVSKYSTPKSGDSIVYASGETRRAITNNTKITVEAEDARYIIFCTSYNDRDTLKTYYPSKLKINNYDYTTSIHKKISDVEDYIGNNKIKLNSILDLHSVNLFNGFFSDNGWNNVKTGNGQHFVIPINPNDEIYAIGGENNSVLAIVKDYIEPVDGEQLLYASGESRRIITKGSSKFFIAPQDARYIVVSYIASGVSLLPANLVVNGYSYNERITTTIANINSNPFIKGHEYDDLKFTANEFYYLNDQTPVNNDNYISTPLLNVQDTELHAIVAAPYSVSAITIFDENLTAIGWITTDDKSNYGNYLIEYSILIKDKYPNARYFRVTSRSTVQGYKANFMLTPQHLINKILEVTSVLKVVSQKNFMGHSNISPMNRPYQFIPCYGQSLSNGSDSLFVQDDSVDGCYMLGDIIGLGTILRPLKLTSNSQHPIVSCINSFATLYHNYINPKMNFITASMGLGGRSIAQLSKSERIKEYSKEYSYIIKDSGAYENKFLASLNNAVNIVGKQNVECPAIIYLQGERDYVLDNQAPDTQPGSVDSAYACGGDKELYKKRMLDLKNDMQTDIMSHTGQSYKPIFCIYQVSGAFIKNDAMTINMAQIEFAEENEDVFLMPSPYFVPNYNSGHLTTNGYRWYGEFLAKALFSILCQNSYWKPMLPYQFKVIEDKIYISIENNVGKLVIDNVITDNHTNSGFAVFLDGVYSSSYIQNVLIDKNDIVITCNQNLSGKKVEIVYGGNKTNGSGNIRDSDPYDSLYNYWNDINDKGTSGTLTTSYRPNIIDKKYPMYNWLMSFYKKIQEN